MRKYNAESPSIVKTKYIEDLGIVNLCWKAMSPSRDENVSLFFGLNDSLFSVPLNKPFVSFLK